MAASSVESISTRLLHDEHQARLAANSSDERKLSRFIGQPDVLSVARFHALRYNVLSYQWISDRYCNSPDDLPRETYPVSAR